MWKFHFHLSLNTFHFSIAWIYWYAIPIPCIVIRINSHLLLLPLISSILFMYQHQYVNLWNFKYDSFILHTHTHSHTRTYALDTFDIRFVIFSTPFLRSCSFSFFHSFRIFCLLLNSPFQNCQHSRKSFQNREKENAFFRTIKWMPINFKCLWRAYFPASTHIFPYCDASHHQSQGEHRTHKKTSTRDHKMTDGQKVTICSV